MVREPVASARGEINTNGPTRSQMRSKSNAVR